MKRNWLEDVAYVLIIVLCIFGIFSLLFLDFVSCRVEKDYAKLTKSLVKMAKNHTLVCKEDTFLGVIVKHYFLSPDSKIIDMDTYKTYDIKDCMIIKENNKITKK